MITAGAASFTYDGLDRVHQRTEAATTSTFIYAGRESDPIGDGTNIYSRQGGRLLGVKNGATNLAAGSNAHGDITHLFNPATANVSDTKIFDPFGVPAGATGTTPNRIGYQSDWTDPTTSEVWMGARWYFPANDTFTSRDVTPGQLRNPVSLNRYTYAANNPTKFADPTGRCLVNVDGNLVDYPELTRCARALRPFNIMTAVSTQGWQLFPCV